MLANDYFDEMDRNIITHEHDFNMYQQVKRVQCLRHTSGRFSNIRAMPGANK